MTTQLRQTYRYNMLNLTICKKACPHQHKNDSTACISSQTTKGFNVVMENKLTDCGEQNVLNYQGLASNCETFDISYLLRRHSFKYSITAVSVMLVSAFVKM
jgi:hypothetical protein